MSENRNLPQVSTKVDLKSLNPLLDKLDLKGLTYKQRQFIFRYNGNAIAAAEAAGYGGNYKYRSHKKAALSKVVFRLMQNEQIQRNIYLIQKQMEAFGVLSIAEAKDIISEIARTSDNEARRLEAAKLCLQWEGALIDPVKRMELDVKMQQHHIQEYRFAGPKSNFLKSRGAALEEVIDVDLEAAAEEAINVEPEPTHAIDLDSIL